MCFKFGHSTEINTKFSTHKIVHRSTVVTLGSKHFITLCPSMSESQCSMQHPSNTHESHELITTSICQSLCWQEGDPLSMDSGAYENVWFYHMCRGI